MLDTPQRKKGFSYRAGKNGWRQFKRDFRSYRAGKKGVIGSSRDNKTSKTDSRTKRKSGEDGKMRDLVGVKTRTAKALRKRVCKIESRVGAGMELMQREISKV